MKKIINNKVYDTHTAHVCGQWANEYGRSDFNFVEEWLYKKKTGEFFLYGEGGSASRYAQSAGQNSWVGGQRIIPLDFDSARVWAEEHLSAAEYIGLFGEPDEDGEKISFRIDLDPKAKRALEHAAQKEGVSQTEIIQRLISEHL